MNSFSHNNWNSDKQIICFQEHFSSVFFFKDWKSLVCEEAERKKPEKSTWSEEEKEGQ